MLSVLKSLQIASGFMVVALAVLYLSTGWPAPTEAGGYGQDPRGWASWREWSHFVSLFLGPALATGAIEALRSPPWPFALRLGFYVASMATFITVVIVAHQWL